LPEPDFNCTHITFNQNITGGTMNIYVGNLSPGTSEDELRAAFSEFGQVSTTKIIKDRFTFESRGFGFVEIPNKTEALEAIEVLNGSELKGNVLTVNEAKPRKERGGGGGRRGRGGDDRGRRY